jgi:flagella synthesis protein FlgN
MNTHAQLGLEDLLDREIEAARALSLALAAERAALTGDEPTVVHQSAADKIRLFAEIEAMEAERRALWNPPEAGTAAESTSVAVTERWKALLELMAGCRRANEVNGHIIHIRQNQIRQLLNIVRGGAPMTYGPQGKTYAKALRALAKA